MTSNPAPVTLYNYGNSQDPACQQSSYLAHIKRTAILQLIGGSSLLVFGIITIILLAFWSYFATAIWSGIVIFGMTGVIGILASSKGNKCLIRIYMAFSIVGSLMGFALFVMYICAACFEDIYIWYYGRYYPICQPGHYSDWIINCSKSVAAREAFDALIAITGFFLFILCIVSASYGCCASCKGCESCCKKCCCEGSGCNQCCAPPPPPVAAVFQPQGAMVSTAGHQEVHHQAGMFIVQQGPCTFMPPPVPTNQGQASYVLMPAGNQVQPQRQPDSTMQPTPPNHVAPPAYYVAGPDHAQFPQVEGPYNDAKQ